MDFIKNLICPAGKEEYNGKCIKVCEPGKSRNFKTGRCNKIKTSKKPMNVNKTIKTKILSPSVNRNSINQMKSATLCPVGKESYQGKCVKVCEPGKSRNSLTGRCRKQISTSWAASKPFTTRLKAPPQKKHVFQLIYDRYKVGPEARIFLNLLVGNASATQMRKIARDNDLYIPLDNYPDDTQMKEYILDEILNLAQNDAWDRNRSETVRIKNIQVAIDQDAELSELLKGRLPAK
jgi:hypothetical protein